jgi:hypothetical protein
MAEMIVPGTYIDVRAEGLISAGRIASGIVGVVGTAKSGPIGQPVTLSTFAEARETFGLADDFDLPENGVNPLTLTRALEHIYNNGASTAIAVRVAAATASSATYAIKNGNDTVVTLSARTPGSWGNDIFVTVSPAEADAEIVNEKYEGTVTSLRRGNIVTGLPTNAIRIRRGTTKQMQTLTVITTGGTVGAGKVRINQNGGLTFASGEEPKADDVLYASYSVNKDACVDVNLTDGIVSETYTVPDGNLLALLVNASSALVTAQADATNGNKKPDAVSAYMGTGSNTPGSNGAEADADDYAGGLEMLANQLVNIVVLAGQNATDMGSVLLGHLKTTEGTDHERIGVIGAAGASVADFLGHDMADGRIILVAPGIRYPDGRTLPSAYTAAAVAGLISSLDVQVSLTNKPLNIPGLALDANRGQQEQLIKKNVLAVVRKNGYRVLKGITTSGEGTPWSSIPTRRIVDYAKYGVRSAADPYLGRLNNSRVRAAMKATLDAFLTRMVDAEQLTGYELDVSATRAQEIAGEVSVIMTLQPTFSIDYIRVTMNLK